MLSYFQLNFLKKKVLTKKRFINFIQKINIIKNKNLKI